MGWRDQSTDAPPGSTPATPAPVPAPAPTTPAKSGGWRDQSITAPVMASPSASASASAPAPPAAASDAPAWLSVENQLGPFAPLFGYKARSQPTTLGNVADIGRVAVSQVPFVDRLTGIDEAAAQERLKGTPYAGAGEVLGGTATGIGGEALGAGRAIAGAAEPYIGSAASRFFNPNTASKVSNFLANRVGGAVEQGGASVAGTLGQGDTDVGDLLKSAAIGAGPGAFMGPMAKTTTAPVARWSTAASAAKAVTTPTTDELEQTARNAFAPLRTEPVNSGQIAKGFNAVNAGMTSGDLRLMSPSLRDEIAAQSQDIYGVKTVDDVAKYQRALMGAAKNSDDRRIAQGYVDGMNQALGPQNAQALATANQASNIAKTSADIDTWLENPAKAPDRITSALNNNPQFYQNPPGLFAALDKIGQAKDPTFWQRAGQAALRKGVAGAAGYGVGSIIGGGPLAGIAGAGLGAALIPQLGVGRVTGIANQLKAAQRLAATGQKPPVGDALLQLMNLARQGSFGAGASGAY